MLPLVTTYVTTYVTTCYHLLPFMLSCNHFVTIFVIMLPFYPHLRVIRICELSAFESYRICENYYSQKSSSLFSTSTAFIFESPCCNFHTSGNAFFIHPFTPFASIVQCLSYCFPLFSLDQSDSWQFLCPGYHKSGVPFYSLISVKH